MTTYDIFSTYALGEREREGGKYEISGDKFKQIKKYIKKTSCDKPMEKLRDCLHRQTRERSEKPS